MLRYVLFAISVSVLWGLSITPCIAASSSLVVSHIQTGGSGTGTSGQEFVAVYNNLSTPIDITDWCIEYSDYSGASVSQLYCFLKSVDMDAVLMPGQSSAVIVSQSYPVQDTSLVTGVFKHASTAMSSTRGHVTLLDHLSSTVDRVAWDNGASLPPIYPEFKAAVAPSGGNMIVRELDSNLYIDTDNNYDDFVSVISQRPTISSLIDYKAPPEEVDMCANIYGMQIQMPDGYGYDDEGYCLISTDDVCANIELIQPAVPVGMLGYTDGNCYDKSRDVCGNIDGLQLELPTNYRFANGICKADVGKKNIKITEVLANSAGVDTGNEFIELYNEDTVVVDLSDYFLAVGKNAEKQISLTSVILEPKQYISFTDTDLGLSLLNTTTRLELRYYDGTLLSEIIPYQDPNEEIAWALVDGVWQYTNNPTPGHANVESVEEVLGDQDTNTTKAIACPSGKYRNPLTNRCRNIETDVNVLASCDADEYRSPDTNRCRKITAAGASLTPCDEGYERNPETNRCRKIINDDDKLAACAEGSERNPLTNRCKKIVESTAGKSVAESAEDGINVGSNLTLTNPYVIAASAGVGALGYGVYEWRTELGLLRRRMLAIFRKK